MKTMYFSRKNKTLLLALAITAVLWTSPGQVNAQVTAPISPATTAIKTVPAVEIMPTLWEFDTKHTNNDFFIKNGTAYLSYKQASVMFQDLVWSYNQKSGILNVSGPNRTLTWKVNTKTATLNGYRRQMSSPLLQRNGDVNLPLRDLLKWAGGTLKSSKNNMIAVSYPIINALSGDAKGWYWVRKDNGIVYTAIVSEMPHNIGKSDVRANQFAEMSVTQTDDHSIVLQLNHSYGEPLIYDDIYKLYIYNGKLVRESRIMYNGGSPRESISEADGFTIMLNGTDLLLVRANGTLEHKYDLKELGGLDESYTVEYVSVADSILLIRPYNTQTLLLIDPKLDAPVVLYKVLLSKEDQDYFEKFEQFPWMTLSDGLQFVKRDGDTFTFKHTSSTTNVSEELTYRLNH